ncbi:MAG: DUF2652 domain-containing protein [Hyphomicrobiales bacterium]|nr:DUF2652 domain-containing protein [Hyphomicrobiales bacterium]
MQLSKAVLVLVDISGYTKFVVLHRISVLHAEGIITELIEAVAAEARVPLRLNKLEGDAALFVAPFEGETGPALDDVYDQVACFFEAFRQKRAEIFEASVGGCICTACQSVEHLELKAIVHVDEIVLKQVGGFEEVAGRGVILLHRLLKNTVPYDEYLLVTKEADAERAAEVFPSREPHVEDVDDLGRVDCAIYRPLVLALERPAVRPLTRPRGLWAALKISWAWLMARLRGQRRSFGNLPTEEA